MCSNVPARSQNHYQFRPDTCATLLESLAPYGASALFAAGGTGEFFSQGYAVSTVKAGARILGRDAGPVRPPLTGLKPAEVEQLAALIKPLGAQ